MSSEGKTPKLINYYIIALVGKSMLHISRTLSFYKRKDIQDEMIAAADQREVAIRYGGKGFGKRPDVLKYPQDILELAQKGATSFHISEERWLNPLMIKTDMRQKELDSIRTGWDLVIDVDFPIWEVTKLITQALIDALKDHGVKSISCKFSGNKGFHIGVPFEAFPGVLPDGNSAELFPSASKRIVLYLLNYIDSKSNDFALSKKIKELSEFVEYLKGSKDESISNTICKQCETELKGSNGKKYEYMCSFCGHSVKTDKMHKHMICSKCKKLMEKGQEIDQQRCPKCKSTESIEKFNWKVDTLLISARHLYRSVYSFHEKSGLVSVPVDPSDVLGFDKKDAKPMNVVVGKHKFLDAKGASQAETRRLIISAYDYEPKQDYGSIEGEEGAKSYKEFDLPEEAIGEECFPPQIKQILRGLKDGRKRALFLLVNYLTCIGWQYDQIEKLLYEWNKRNKEPLREVLIKGQLRYHKQQKKKILPPNFDNKAYYLDMGITESNELSKKYNNPVFYSKVKAKMIAEHEKRNKRRKKKDEGKSKKAKKDPRASGKDKPKQK